MEHLTVSPTSVIFIGLKTANGSPVNRTSVHSFVRRLESCQKKGGDARRRYPYTVPSPYSVRYLLLAPSLFHTEEGMSVSLTESVPHRSVAPTVVSDVCLITTGMTLTLLPDKK